MEEEFIHVADGKGGEKEMPIRLSNGNLDIRAIQGIIQSGTPIVIDGELINVLIEIVGRYPIGNYPIVPVAKEKSIFTPDPEAIFA